jgi:nitrite reductase (NO-forming)
LIEIGPMSGGEAAARTARPALTERHVLALGLGAAGVFVAAAMVAAVAAVIGALSSWAALHLALAGAATVAIGAFMPHFAVTLAGTRPSPSPHRLASLAALAVGSLGAVVGVLLVERTLVAMATTLTVIGLLLVAWHTFAPLRQPLARRHHVVTAAYGTALVELAAGVVLGGLGGAGVAAITAHWALLRPAHAWLTLYGAVSLTIFATLVYLAPTVLGARIRASLALVAGTLGMAFGPILAALGFAIELRPVLLAGAGLTLLGGIGQIAYVVDCYRRRGPFTTEHDWRAVSIGHLLLGPAWFVAAVAVALVDVAAGRALAGWSLGLLALPLVAGWMLQELVGSWTHLVPSVTPGTPERHARQRRMLAVAPRLRVTAWNLAVALAWTGLALDLAPMSVAGFVLLAASVVVALTGLTRSLTAGRA